MGASRFGEGSRTGAISKQSRTGAEGVLKKIWDLFHRGERDAPVG